MKRRTLRNWLLLSTAAWTVGTAASLLLLVLVPFLFDAPGADHNPATLSLAGSVACLPVCCLVSLALPWYFFRKDRTGPALIFALLPLIPLGAMALSFAALEFFFGGQLGR
jgi:hypothetical protein